MSSQVDTGEPDGDAAGVATRLGGLGGEVTLADLFPSAWMHGNTEFDSFDQMLESSGYDVTCETDFRGIPDHEWDEFVVRHTSFGSWREMLATAMDQYVTSGTHD